MIPLIVIAGPTASGKTALAIETAKLLDGEIISADSMQVYKKMNIGTAKPDMEERRGIPHHLIDVKEPWEDFSVSDFAELAHKAIADIHLRGKMPILAGGTGLYIDNVVYNIKLSQESFDKSIREKLVRRSQEEGGASLLRELSLKDPQAASKLHANDTKRIIRALEILEATGKTKSEHDKASKKTEKIYDSFYFAIELDREILYNKINMRVDKMIESGLASEAFEIYRLIRGKCGTSLQSVGYKELFWYFKGLSTFDEAVEMIKKNTRHLAKRQITWFGKNQDIIRLDGSRPADKLADHIKDIISAKGIV